MPNFMSCDLGDLRTVGYVGIDLGFGIYKVGSIGVRLIECPTRNIFSISGVRVDRLLVSYLVNVRSAAWTSGYGRVAEDRIERDFCAVCGCVSTIPVIESGLDARLQSLREFRNRYINCASLRPGVAHTELVRVNAGRDSQHADPYAITEIEETEDSYGD